MLMVGDQVHGLLVDHLAGGWAKTTGFDPGAGGFADLFDRQVQDVGRFFL